MKVAILTQPLKSNYGGILQNYAMQKALKDIGLEPVTIDLKFDKYSYIKWFISFGYYVLMKMLGRKVSLPITPRRQKVIDSLFVPFMTRHIATTKPYFTIPNSIVAKEGFDAIIVGSDQVWRPKYNKKIEDMFLGFAEADNIVRLSYAASFGTDEWEFDQVQNDTCKNLVKRFNGVSVRELSAVELCRKYFDVDAAYVPDPTMLVTVDIYRTLCKNIPIDEEKFVFVYFFSPNDVKNQLVNRLAEKYNLKIKRADISSPKYSITIEEWLANIRDAECVITDSYHGTLFSVYFEKSYISIRHSSRGNTRFDTLTEKLGLKNIYTENQLLNIVDIPEHENLKEMFENLRLEGLNFLKSNIIH